MADRHDHTEKATGRKRQQAREKGQVARSRDLVSMASTGGVVLVITFWGAGALTNLAGMMRGFLSLRYGTEISTVMRAAGVETAYLLSPFLLAAAGLAIAANLVQGGLVIKPFELQPSRINPLEGAKKIFSSTGLVDLAKNLVKFSVGGYVAYIVLRKEIFLLPSLLQLPIPEIVRVSFSLLFKALLTGFGFFFVIAVLDYFVERWRFEKSLKMTKTEVKDEYKEVDGNPMIKSRIRSLMKEMARKRMMKEVPKATVVITNPVHLAVALRYDDKSMSAPRIVAKGADHMSEKIKEIARRHGIPIVEDKPLARSLYKFDVGAYVPEELYRAVASILAQIFQRTRRVM
ncbi:MAG: flagellar biosynthesis protein FlhB [bacterium]|jgi:flagellar biosynthetic protein FlhB